MKRLLLTLLLILLAAPPIYSGFISQPGGGGVVTETQTLDDAFELGNTIDGVNESKKLEIRGTGDGANDGFNAFVNSAQVPQFLPVCNGVENDCDRVHNVPTGKTIDLQVNSSSKLKITGDGAVASRIVVPTNTSWCLYDEEAGACIITIDPGAASANAMYTLGANYKIRKSIWVPASAMYGDGTQCPAAPSTVTINSGAPMSTFICTDNDAATLYGTVAMPQSWDGGAVTFAHHYIQTAADTSALNGDIAASCRLAAATINNTWGTEVAIDDAAVTGSNALDITTSAGVTPNGTCTSGASRILQFRYQLDATGTTTAVNSLHHVGFLIEYVVDSLSD